MGPDELLKLAIRKARWAKDAPSIVPTPPLAPRKKVTKVTIEQAEPDPLPPHEMWVEEMFRQGNIRIRQISIRYGGPTTIGNIAEAVAEVWGKPVTPENLLKKGNVPALAEARKVFVYLVTEDVWENGKRLSWSEIGRRLDGRDHSSMYYIIETYFEKHAGDPKVQQNIFDARLLYMNMCADPYAYLY